MKRDSEDVGKNESEGSKEQVGSIEKGEPSQGQEGGAPSGQGESSENKSKNKEPVPANKKEEKEEQIKELSSKSASNPATSKANKQSKKAPPNTEPDKTTQNKNASHQTGASASESNTSSKMEKGDKNEKSQPATETVKYILLNPATKVIAPKVKCLISKDYNISKHFSDNNKQYTRPIPRFDLNFDNIPNDFRNIYYFSNAYIDIDHEMNLISYIQAEENISNDKYPFATGEEKSISIDCPNISNLFPQNIEENVSTSNTTNNSISSIPKANPGSFKLDNTNDIGTVQSNRISMISENNYFLTPKLIEIKIKEFHLVHLQKINSLNIWGEKNVELLEKLRIEKRRMGIEEFYSKCEVITSNLYKDLDQKNVEEERKNKEDLMKELEYLREEKNSFEQLKKEKEKLKTDIVIQIQNILKEDSEKIINLNKVLDFLDIDKYELKEELAEILRFQTKIISLDGLNTKLKNDNIDLRSKLDNQEKETKKKESEVKEREEHLSKKEKEQKHTNEQINSKIKSSTEEREYLEKCRKEIEVQIRSEHQEFYEREIQSLTLKYEENTRKLKNSLEEKIKDREKSLSTTENDLIDKNRQLFTLKEQQERAIKESLDSTRIELIKKFNDESLKKDETIKDITTSYDLHFKINIVLFCFLVLVLLYSNFPSLHQAFTDVVGTVLALEMDD